MLRTLNEPTRYGFGELLIGGQWCCGNAATSRTDVDPYTGEILVEIGQADIGDVDTAFRAAAAAQRDWAGAGPGERGEVLRRAVSILEARRAEVIDWLIKESGSVRIKAELEWSAVKAIMTEASTLPTRAWGRIIPGDIPGKEHRIYRHPVGVVTVISPWNWPLHLTSQSRRRPGPCAR